MIELKTDCVTLEEVVCSGELSPVRWFCPREIQSFWREAWLRRAEPDQAAALIGSSQIRSDHHAGVQQVDADEGGGTSDA